LEDVFLNIQILKKGCYMNKKIWFLGSIVALLVVVMLGFSYVKAESTVGKYNPPRMLNVNGTGIVKASPDMARIVLGYVNEEKDAKSSQANNAKVSNEIIRVLKGLGIDDKDLQTVDFSITPVYTYEPNKDPYIRGYQTSNMLSVAVRDLGKIGTVIDVSASAGANRFQNISFDIADRETIKFQAIEEAMRDARKKAETALKPEGEKILQIVTISVDGGWAQTTPTYRNDMKEGVAPSAPTIQPGELSITITVQVTYSF
jgi:uncharacterized protein